MKRWLIGTMPVLLAMAIPGCTQGESAGMILTQSTSTSSAGVELIVFAAPDPEGGLLITATARNGGPETFRYTATCGRADMEFRFSDALGNEIRVTNPCEPQPMMDCPTALGMVLGPDDRATDQHWWSGQLWDGCTGTLAPGGDYRVTVIFTFYEDIEIGQDEVEATGTFHWGSLTGQEHMNPR